MARKNDKPDDIARLETALEEMRSRERELEASRKAMLFLLEDLEANRRLIEQAKREWTAVFDTLRDAVFIHDRQMRIVRANRAYAERAGMEIKELIGKPYWQVFPKRAEPLPGCLRALQKAEEEEEEIKAGESILRSRAFTIRDPDNAHQYSIHILEDITEKRRAEAERYRLSEAIRQAAEAIMMVNADTRISYINPAFSRLLGYAPDQIIGQPTTILAVPGAGTVQPDEALRIVREQGGFQGEILRRARDGEVIPVYVNVAALYGAEDVFDGFVTAITDLRPIKKAQQALVESEKLYRSLFENMLNGFAYCQMIFEQDQPKDFIYLSVNAAFETMTGLKNVVGKRVSEVIPGLRQSDAKLFEIYGRVSLSGKPERFEIYLEALQQWLWISVYSPGKGYFAVVFDVITERKRAEQALQKLNRALRVLSQCNEALIHAEDEPDLLGDVCRVIVETGGYRMAWVGFTEHDEGKTVRPVAHCGHEAGILESARISWAENEQCLAGIAIRTGSVQIAQNFGADSGMAAWHPEAAKLGYASGIALPLKDAAGAFGTLVIIAAEPDAFDVEEMKLLQELADDVAYGIGALRAEESRRRAEQELQASEARLRRIVDQQADGLVVVDMNGVVTFLNPAAERFLGRPRDALLGSPFGYPVIGKATTEVQVARPDGSTGYAEMRAIESEWGGEQAYLLSLHDITERKQFEEALQQGAARLKRVLEETIQAVALAAEKRDPYTAGHQQRVTELAVAIAREIGWDENRIEGLRLGAAIHDIGKIYVPAEILSRPGKLSPTEFEMIKSHCQVGYEIMRGVEFPWPVAEMILQHHERFDGSGYPNRLKGDEILPEARILMVADVVEAMASHRPYRSALSLDAALAEISGKRGTWYEAEAVDACLRLFREKGYRLG